MKITPREKTMLIILGILGMLGLYYYLVLGPQLDRIAQITKKITENTMKLQTMDQQIRLVEKTQKDFKEIIERVRDKSKRYLSRLEQEKITVILNDILVSSQMNRTSITFAEPEVTGALDKGSGEQSQPKSGDASQGFALRMLADQYGRLNATAGQSKPVDDAQSKPANNGQAAPEGQKSNSEAYEKMALNMIYKGSYESTMAFIKSLETLQVNGENKKIIVRSISCNFDDSGSLSGSIQADLSAIPKVEEPLEEEYFQWDFQRDYTNVVKNGNPFGGKSGNGAPEQAVAQAFAAQYDFIMTLKPITADLPTIRLGRSKDKSGESYVSIDSEAAEEVEMQLTKKGNQYFCKYRTNQESYPMAYEGDGEEFQPSGAAIAFNIISSKRNGPNDKCGINLTVINNTDLPLNVKVDNDDKTKPRVDFKFKHGNININ